MSLSASRLEEIIEGAALIAAPVLFLTSTFYWHNGEYNNVSATLMILSLFFWLPAFKALFKVTSQKLPLYSVLALWIAYFGCISGICFAFLGYMATVLDITHAQYLDALKNYPLTSQILLFASGPIFPLTFLMFGVQMLRTHAVPSIVGILFCLAGVAFPVSRIARIEWIAHIADLLLLVPCLYIFFKAYVNNSLVQKTS